MQKLTTIVIKKQKFHFSAAHFTIFSATNRERLHGHNFRIGAEITGETDDNGLCFDYAVYKKILTELCQRHDEYTLIAAQSPFLKITDEGDYYYVEHDTSKMVLLKSDTLLLPLRNITIEELSHYFLDQLLQDRKLIKQLKIQAIEMHVSSGPDQWGVARWQSKEK